MSELESILKTLHKVRSLVNQLELHQDQINILKEELQKTNDYITYKIEEKRKTMTNIIHREL